MWIHNRLFLCDYVAFLNLGKELLSVHRCCISQQHLPQIWVGSMKDIHGIVYGCIGQDCRLCDKSRIVLPASGLSGLTTDFFERVHTLT